jgi:hypothetical protein
VLKAEGVASMADKIPELEFDLSFLSPGAAQPPARATANDNAIPDIVFDLSFLHEGEAVDVKQPEVGDLEMRDYRQRQERDLQEWFAQRATELARSAAERHERGADRLERRATHQTGNR